MSNKNLVASSDGVLLKVGDRIQSLYKGGGVPNGADQAHVDLLVDRGLLVEADDDQSAPVEDHSDGGAPAKSASKADWVAYAVSQGADEATAEAATKEDLVAQFGG